MMPAIRSILSLPRVYQLFWTMVGGPNLIRTLVQEHMQSKPGDRVLDIGCGPGTVFPYLPKAEYWGIDISPSYIDSGRRRFPNATFVCERVSSYTLPEKQRSSFDLALSMGVLHHLDDVEALSLFQLAYAALRLGGKLITCDGCYTPDQNRMARYFLSKDRGRHVRTREGYLKVASQVFPSVRMNIRNDLIRIPYSHIIMECVREN